MTEEEEILEERVREVVEVGGGFRRLSERLYLWSERLLSGIGAVVLLLVAVLFAAWIGFFARSSPLANRSATEAGDLAGSEWLLASLNGNPVLEETRITLSFDDKVTGNAGCNYYEAEYTATGGALSIPEVEQSAMDCPAAEGILDQEKAYMEALYSAASYQIVEGRLEIANEAGETTLVFVRSE